MTLARALIATLVLHGAVVGSDVQAGVGRYYLFSPAATTRPSAVPPAKAAVTVPGMDEALFASSFDLELSRVQNVRIDLPDGSYLPARLYGTEQANGAAIVMMHGCSGMWSQGEPWSVAQSAIEKWGLELARNGYVALAIDSYTSRAPAGVDARDYQRQCAGDVYEGSVDPYTTRVGDIETGSAWLRYRLGSAARRIGTLGWSQGAQSVLVRSAETYADENVSRFDDPADEANAPLASVAFYPGCGTNLGFVDDGRSFWRPHRDLRLNHGGADPLHESCVERAQIAAGTYGSTLGSGHWVDYVEYPAAQHSFDGAISDWPTSRCAPDAPPSDACAASDADISSLEFLQARLGPEG